MRTAKLSAKFLGIVVASGLSWLAAGSAFCAPASTEYPMTPPPPQTKEAPVAQPLSAEEMQKHEEWQAAVSRATKDRKGCFTASYPSTELREVPCTTAPVRPYPPKSGSSPQTVGNGTDFSAVVTGTMTQATGSFDTVQGMTSETGGGNPNSYSLQVNSSFFASPACAGAAVPANCRGWEQFVYSNAGTALIQYWLINWGSPGQPCPGGWFTFAPHCFRNGVNSVAVPVQPLANFSQLRLRGQAVNGGNDTITMFVPGNMYSASNNDNVVSLAQGWTTAEYNVVGDCCGSQAAFNTGTRMAVRTAVVNGTSSAPTCTVAGFTGETNSLTLVPPCCPYGGMSPAIVFWQSSNVGATSQCSGGTSIGDTHLTNFNGLYYDFQAAGDFLLARTNSNFIVQTRQRSGAPNWPNAAVNKAVGLQLGRTKLALCLDPTRLVIDGKPVDLGEDKTLTLPGGTVQRNGNVYAFTRPSGENVRAEVNAGWINVSVGLGSLPVASVSGLLGNVNGPMGPTDLGSRPGQVFHQPVSFGDLYNPYGDSWRVAQKASIPAQMCGDKGFERGNPSKPFFSRDLKPDDYKRARAICERAGVKDETMLDSCIIDVAVLGETAARAFARKEAPRGVVRFGERAR